MKLLAKMFALVADKFQNRTDKQGLPMIGSGLAAGRWESIKLIIQQELKDCNVTVVIHKT